MSNVMKIKLLHAVLCDGHRVEAGQTGDIEEALAAELIASGAAVAVEEPQSANTAGNAAPKEPEPLLQPEAGQPAASPTASADVKSVGTETKTEPATAAEPKTAEAETKAAKGKEGK